IQAVAPFVIFDVVLKTVEHAAEVFGGLSVAERHQLEKDVEWQRCKRQRKTSFDLGRNGMSHNLAESSHVQHKTFFELETAGRSNRVTEREEIDKTAGAMPHPLRRAAATEIEFRKAIF